MRINHATKDNSLQEPYTVILIADSSGGYTAEILEFPGCFAEGETANEAIDHLKLAAASWERAALAQGQDIPPQFRHHGYGGKIALRLPKSLHRHAALLAARDGVSLNQFLVATLAAGCGACAKVDAIVHCTLSVGMPYGSEAGQRAGTSAQSPPLLLRHVRMYASRANTSGNILRL